MIKTQATITTNIQQNIQQTNPKINTHHHHLVPPKLAKVGQPSQRDLQRRGQVAGRSKNAFIKRTAIREPSVETPAGLALIRVPFVEYNELGGRSTSETFFCIKERGY